MTTAKMFRARDEYLQVLEDLGTLQYFTPDEDYQGNSVPISHTCTTCQFKVIRAPVQMKIGFKTCPVCLASGGQGVKLTFEILRARFSYRKIIDFELIAYESKTLTVRHLCGSEFSISYDSFFNPVVVNKCLACSPINRDGIKVRVLKAVESLNLSLTESLDGCGWSDRVGTKCNDCGVVKQKSLRMLIQGRGCRHCSTEMPVDQLEARLGERGYDFVCRSQDKHITAKCKAHGEFSFYGVSMKAKTLCPKCRNYDIGKSKVCTEWLDAIIAERRINIQHHSNGGEYSFGRRYRADGICFANNTVYEFHGDIFHGNPELFAPDDCPNYFHPTWTAAEMYAKTLEKERFIRDLGWNYVHIWEKTYREAYARYDTWAEFLNATLPVPDAELRVGHEPIYVRAWTGTFAEDRGINLGAMRSNMGGDRLHTKGSMISIDWAGESVEVEVEHSTTTYLEFWYWDEKYQDYHLYCKGL